MHLIKHAQARQQQRGIPPIIIDLLREFGAVERTKGNAPTFYFDKASRCRVLAYAGPLSRAIEEFLDYYAVISDDDRVITVAPRLKRLKH